MKKVEFIEPLVKPEDEEPPVQAEEEEALEIILPEEEDPSLPVGEIILPDPDEMIEFEPADEPAEKPAGKEGPEAAKDVPELIIEEPTLF